MEQLAEMNQILKSECRIIESIDYIIKKIIENHISVLHSVTGSGKTTAIPFKIYEAFFKYVIPLPINQKYIKILCIVPSRAICMSMYTKFKNIFIGIKMKNVNFNPDAPIIYITYGTLSKIYDESKNYHPNYLDQFSVFIWDEAHEIVNMKFEKHRVRSIMKTYGKSRHVFMSATFTKDLIESALKYKFNPDSIITFDKESRKYEIIEDNCDHLLTDSMSMEDACVIAYNYYYEKNKESSDPVLIFLPTISSGIKLKSMLGRLYDSSSHTIVIINSELEPNELENVLTLLTPKVIPNETIDSNKMIVITTSFLDSGVTIVNAQVIDSGREIKIVKNSDFTNIRIVKSSESTTIQRRGRTGRTKEGFYMNLFNSNMTNIIYKNRLDEEEYLHMIFLNLIDETKPKLEKILLNYEAINSDNSITQLGEQSIKCNIHPKFMKLIDISNHFMDGKYTWLIIAIIVFLDIDKLFNTSEDENIKYRRSEMLDIIKGDMLIGAYLYSQTYQYTHSQICSWYGIYKKKFIFACSLIEKLYLKLSITNFGQFNSKDLIDIIKNSKLFNIVRKYDSMYFDYPTEPIDIQLYQQLPENILNIICEFVNPTIKEKGLICPFIHHTSRDLSHSTNSILYSKLQKNTKGRMILSGSISLDKCS